MTQQRAVNKLSPEGIKKVKELRQKPSIDDDLTMVKKGLELYERDLLPLEGSDKK